VDYGKAWGKALWDLGVGGVGVASGVGLCGTFVGCVMGAPLTAFSGGKFFAGVDWLIAGDEVREGYDPVRSAIMYGAQAAGASERVAGIIYGAGEMASGGLSLIAPVRAFERLWTPWGIEQTSGLAVTIMNLQTQPVRALAIGTALGGGAITIVDQARR
jgi:hypothetical protein